MQEDKQRGRQFAWLLGTGLLMLVFGVLLLWFQLPMPGAETGAPRALVAPGCEQAQTIDYLPCGHQVLRRIDAPAKWAGMTKDAVEAEMESPWRMTAFSPDVVEMICALDLYCPQHWVLSLNADGIPGIYRNQLGFEMERVGEAVLGPLTEETRALLIIGIPFDTRDALDAWASAYRAR